MILLLAATSVLASLPYRAPVDVPPGAEYVSVRLDRSAYDRSRSRFNDLRVSGPGGETVPHFMHVSRTTAHTESLLPIVTDRVLTPAGELSVTLRLADPKAAHSRISLDVAETGFRREYVLESSSDGRRWDFVRKGYVMEFQEEANVFRLLDIDYPQSTRNYLRLRISGWKDPATLTAVNSYLLVEQDAQWELLATARPTVTVDRNSKASVFSANFGVQWVDNARIEVVTSTPEFHRRLQVYGQNTIYRYGGSESLTFDAQGIDPRKFRLQVFDRDNPPLDISELRLYAPVQRAVFRVTSPGRYYLLLGAKDLLRARYDIEEIFSRQQIDDPVRIKAGAWEANPAYKEPPPIPVPVSERFPQLIAIVITAATLLMGLAAWRLMRKPIQ